MFTPGHVLAAVLALLLIPSTSLAQASAPAQPPSTPCARLAAAGAVPDEGDSVSAVVDCAYDYSDNNDHDTATRLFDLAVQTGTGRGDAAGLSRALNGLANERLVFGNGQGVEALLAESLRVSEQSGDRNGMARAASSLGGLRSQQARYDEALTYHQRSLELWTAVGSKSGVATALNNVGGSYRALGDFNTALQYLQRSLDALDEQGDRRRSATVLDNMGIAARRLGDYERGLELAERGLAIRESFNDHAGIAKSLDSLSEAYGAQGNWSAALAAVSRSLDIRRELGLVHALAEALNNIAVVYEAQGSYGRAVASLQEALALNTEKVGSVSLGAEIQTHLGEVYLREGRLARARQALAASVAITERHGYKEQGASARYALGRTHVAGRQLTAARAQFEHALALRDAIGDRGGRAAVLVELADLDRRQRRLQRGRERADEAAAIAQATEMPDLEWRAVTLIGRLQLATGDQKAAIQSFDRAIALVEAVRDRNAGSELARSLFFADRLAPFHARLAVAVANGRPAEALAYAERLKARALLDILRGGTSITTAMTSDQQERERVLRTALASASSELEQAVRMATPDAARVAALRRTRNERRQEYETFEARLYAELPMLQADRGVLPPLTATEARTLIPTSRSAVVEYVVGPERAFAVVVTRSTVKVFTLAGSAGELTDRVGQFTAQLAGRDLRVVATARLLHQQLLAPLGDALSNVDDLIVVPDGVLWKLPFQALQSSSGRYAIEDMAISYAPSLMALREMMRPGRRPSGTRPLLAFGNPSRDSEDSLPDAETEVRRVAQVYGSASRVLIGADAREERWASDAGLYRVVHVAAHGTLDDASPLYSSLQLAMSQGGIGQDGRLEAWEIMKAPLAADLVVFSACDSAGGRIAPGEGIVGLMWATFVAGSRAALVSQWRVDSRASADLMIRFHQVWNTGAAPPSKARALQAASLAVLRSPGRAHPFYWAGFILGGDGR